MLPRIPGIALHGRYLAATGPGTDIGGDFYDAFPAADDRWILAHAVHLDRLLAGTVVHNPRSNLNNAVGYGRPARFPRVALGTDGIGADILEEFRLAFVLGVIVGWGMGLVLYLALWVIMPLRRGGTSDVTPAPPSEAPLV